MAYKPEDLKAKQDQLRQLWEQAKEIDKKAREEKRSLTQEEEAAWNKANTDISALEAELRRMHSENEREQKVAELDARFSKADAAPPDTTTLSGQRREDLPMQAREEYRSAFNEYLRTGDKEKFEHEIRTTMQVDSPLYGGYLVASERFIQETIKAADEENVVAGLIRTIQCGYEETLGAPSLDTDISNFSFAGETTEAEEDQIKVGKRELKPRPLKPKVVKLSKFLLESPRYNTEALVTERLGMALGRTFEYYYQLGSGANQPLGLFTANNNGIGKSRDVSIGNTASSPTFDGLINAEGALKYAYRTNAKYLFHLDAETKLRLLKDGESRYIWQMGNVQAGVPNTILGRPYVLSQYCPHTFTTGQYVGILGDFRYYWAAVTLESLRIQRLVELYALNDLIGLKTDRIGVDGMPVNAEAFVRIKLG